MLKESYEEVPYRARCYGFSHPSHLLAVAALSGLSKGSISGSRILELGCGAGGNLIPIAFSCPNASCVGIDLSPSHLTLAKGVATRASIKNCEFLENDLRKGTPKLPPFDFIIAHGLISWVSPETRAKIFEAVATLLKPQGIAYLSFNVLPGAHFKMLAREAMLFHTEALQGSHERAKGAAGFLNFLSAAQPNQDALYAKVIQAELESVRRHDLSHFLHDYLEEDNHPMLFSQFISEASAVGLRYIADASLGTLQLDGLSSDVQKQLLALAANSRERLEQYLDFVVGRGFRQAVVCHQEHARLQPVQLKSIGSLWVTSPFALHSKTPENMLRGEKLSAELEFSSVNSRLGLKIKDAVGAAVLLELQKVWPSMCTISQLVERVRSRLDSLEIPDFEQRALSNLVGAIAKGVVIVRSENPVPSPSGRMPVGHPIARIVAKERIEVPNYLHQSVVLSDENRWVLERLDGVTPMDELQVQFDRAGVRDSSSSAQKTSVKTIVETLQRYALAR